MGDPRLTITRRKLVQAGLTVPVVSAFGASACWARGDDLRDMFETFLARVPVRLGPFQLTAQRFDTKPEAGGARIETVVQMTWPPGRRRRMFQAQADNEAQAFQALCAEIETYFASVS